MSNSIFIITITGLAHDGRGIGFLPQPGQKRGLAVFVERALPGQTIRCVSMRNYANYHEAKLLEVLKSDFTPDTPHCPQQIECGGCPLQPLPYPLQLQWKEKLVLDAMLRIGKLPAAELHNAWEGLTASPATQSFRNKVVLAFGKTADGLPALGFRSRGSHVVLPFDACALIEQSAYPIICQANKLALASKLPVFESSGFWRFLTLRRAATADSQHLAWHAILTTSPADKIQSKIVTDLGVRLLADHTSLASFTHEERRRNDRLAAHGTRKLRLGRGDRPTDIALELGGRTFCLDVGSFFQVNGPASQILAKTAKDMDTAARGHLLDLYCGVGAPGQLLAERHESCFGIERDAAAIKWARENAAGAGLAAWKYACGNAEEKTAELARTSKYSFQAVLLDPPRSGIGKMGIRNIVKLAPENIIYISCNPATLARDAEELQKGYKMERLAGVDMFPHTPHLECCGIWTRRE